MAFQRIMLKDIRLAFTKFVFNPKEEDSDSYYKIAAAVEPDSDHHKQIMNAVKAVASEQWQDKANGVVRKLAADRRICYSSKPPTNEEGEVYAGFEDGQGIINAARSCRRVETVGVPLVIGGGADGKGKLVQSDGKIYGGAYANLLLEIWTQDNKHGKRINADFRGVQFLRDGERLGGEGGVPTSENEFETLDRADSMADALEGEAPKKGYPYTDDDDISDLV